MQDLRTTQITTQKQFTQDFRTTQIATQKQLNIFRAKHLIPVRSNSLWLVKQGFVKTVTWHEDGEPIILGFWGPGDVIGLPLSQDRPYELYCVTRVRANCLSWNNDRWTLDAICRYIHETEKLLYLVRCGRVSQRLWKTLVWLSDKFGHPVGRGRTIALPLTHQELAELIGASRVSITRLINQFEREGLLIRSQRHITILQPTLKVS